MVQVCSNWSQISTHPNTFSTTYTFTFCWSWTSASGKSSAGKFASRVLWLTAAKSSEKSSSGVWHIHIIHPVWKTVRQYDILIFVNVSWLQHAPTVWVANFHCFPPVLAMRNCLRRIRRLRLRSFRVRQPSPRWPATSTVQRNQKRMLWEGTHWTTSFHSTKLFRSPKGEDKFTLLTTADHQHLVWRMLLTWRSLSPAFMTKSVKVYSPSKVSIWATLLTAHMMSSACAFPYCSICWFSICLISFIFSWYLTCSGYVRKVWSLK